MLKEQPIRKMMNINFNSFSCYAVSFLKESILPSFTAQQKKILVIASIAFGVLAAWYVASRCCLTAKNLNGPGTKLLPDGTVENGEFKDDKLNGLGSISFPNGGVESGLFSNGELHGKGKISFADGTVWEGEFSNGKLHQGKKTEPNGDFLEGEFDPTDLFNRRTVLKGRKSLKDGQFLEGEIKDEKLHGIGKFRTYTGAVMEGEWKDGHLVQGKITKGNGEVVEGEFLDNYCLFGEGRRITYDHDDGTFFTEEGHFLENELHGYGKITFADGTVLQGQFNNGVIKGKRIRHDRAVLEGDIKHGALHGRGTITFPNGDIVSGNFERGSLV